MFNYYDKMSDFIYYSNCEILQEEFKDHYESLKGYDLMYQAKGNDIGDETKYVPIHWNYGKGPCANRKKYFEMKDKYPEIEDLKSFLFFTGVKVECEYCNRFIVDLDEHIETKIHQKNLNKIIPIDEYNQSRKDYFKILSEKSPKIK